MHACSVVNEFKLFVTLQTVVHQAPLSKGFSRQEYWSGLSCPAPGDLPDSGIEPESRCISCIAGRIFITEPLEKPRFGRCAFLNVFQQLLYLFITSPSAIHCYTLCQQLQLICCQGFFSLASISKLNLKALHSRHTNTFTRVIPKNPSF